MYKVKYLSVIHLEHCSEDVGMYIAHMGSKV